MDMVALDVSLPRCGVYCGSWNEIQIRIFFKTWVHFVAVIPETPNAISTRCPIWYRRDRDSWLSFVAWIRLQCAGSNSASSARSIDMCIASWRHFIVIYHELFAVVAALASSPVVNHLLAMRMRRESNTEWCSASTCTDVATIRTADQMRWLDTFAATSTL